MTDEQCGHLANALVWGATLSVLVIFLGVTRVDNGVAYSTEDSVIAFASGGAFAMGVKELADSFGVK